MKLLTSLLALTISGIISPAAVAGQQGLKMEWNGGQKARPDPVALFGDGTQTNGLINGVLIGGNDSVNTYPDMRWALHQLGFRGEVLDANGQLVGNLYPTANTMPTVNAVSPHESHFHIYLQPPKLEGIHAANALMVADAGNTTMLASATDALILADAATKIITPEIVRKINSELANTCTSSENQSFVEGRKAYLGGISPSDAVVALLKYKYGIEAAGSVNAVITQQPVHGKIATIGLDSRSFPGIFLEVFEYTPDKGFLGDDKVVFEVTANGQKFRVSVVVKVVTSDAFNDACLPPDADSSVSGTDIQVAIEDMQYLQDANAPEVATSWQSLFAQNEQIINSINLSFADLAGGAIGQTEGEGINANITLDTNAAGYNWFIDTTPADNSEFLPTSNPNEWVAKAGSAAYGKMDMLSVLLEIIGDRPRFPASSSAATTAPPVSMPKINGSDPSPQPSGKTTSHLTRLADYTSQVVGYPASGRRR